MRYDPALMNLLEPTQRTAATKIPLPRRALGPWTRALLILLRIYVILAVPLVGYSFVHALLAPQ
jgi:hypothetical protein